jgi:alcohol dehydrogenase class IV
MQSQQDSPTILQGSFNYPTMRRVRFGPGSIESLAADVSEFGGNRVMVIASGHLARETDLVKRAERLLGGCHVATYTGIAQHGPREGILDGARIAREKRVDFLVSFGGGSPIDAAKMISLCLGEGIENRDQMDRYVVHFEYPDKFHIPNLNGTQVPVIAIPTTLSAGEFTAYAGALNETNQHKELYFGEKLMAKEVILDPEVTSHTPAWLWGASGMRSIDHCVETLLSTQHMPLSDATATEALRKLMSNLLESSRRPNDLERRQSCQFGAWLSILSLGNVSMGLSHAIGHQLGGLYNITHGVTSAIMLPVVMDYNLSATLDRQIRIAAAMGVDTRGLSEEEAGRAAIATLHKLIADLELPSSLREVKVPKADFERLVNDTMEDALVVSNPRPVKREDVFGILERAF